MTTARVEGLEMNLSPHPEITVYQTGRYTFRTPPPQLYDESNNIVPLSSAALVVLQSLLVNRDRVVSRDELLSTAWPDCIVESNNLDQAITALRKQIPAEQIVSVRARKPTTSGGYRYIGPFEQIHETKAVQEEASPAVNPDGRHRKAWLSFARTIISSYEHRSPVVRRN